MAGLFGDIISSLSLAAGQSVRRNAADNGFEAYTPLGAFANQSANAVYAGPTSGGSAAPAFRALVADDIPNLSAAKITSGLTTGQVAHHNGTSLVGDAALTYASSQLVAPRLKANLNNADYTNTSGAGTHILMTNANGGGQNVIYSEINGTMRAKWRTDSAGNVNWVANGGYHGFYTGGDFGSGTVKLHVAAGGDVGIGYELNAPAARLHVIKTTEQLRLGYDTSNYLKFTVGSGGQVTYDAVGTSAQHIFKEQMTVEGDVFCGLSSSSGPVVVAPDAGQWRIVVDNSGTLSTVSV
jgi:hypothetical protein